MQLFSQQNGISSFINECELQCLFMFLLDNEKQHGWMDGWNSAKFVLSMEKKKLKKQLLNITALMTRLGCNS